MYYTHGGPFSTVRKLVILRRGGYGGVRTLARIERRGFGNTLMRLKQKNLGAPRRNPRRAMEHRGVGGATSCHHVSNVRL